jgi:hypothetical protein
LEQLFQTEAEARVSAGVRAAGRALTEQLNQSVRRLRQADGFGEIAAILCDAAAPFAHVCAVFNVNELTVTGERMRGISGEEAARFQALQFAATEAAAFAGAIESREPVVAICSAAEVSPALVDLFGHPPEDRAYLFPLTVVETTVGLLYAAGEVDSAALELLAQSAGAILEARQQPVPAAALNLVRIAAAKDAAAPIRPGWDTLSLADRNLHLRAQRFARVQVAEMRLYRPDAVKAGRARGDLYAALQEAIEAARETFRQTFIMASPAMADYLHEELLRTLAHDNPAWLGEKYPGPLV